VSDNDDGLINLEWSATYGPRDADPLYVAEGYELDSWFAGLEAGRTSTDAYEDGFESGYTIGSAQRLKAYAIGIVLGLVAGVCIAMVVR
jgi:hypothetical protein